MRTCRVYKFIIFRVPELNDKIEDHKFVMYFVGSECYEGVLRWRLSLGVDLNVKFISF